MVLTSSQLKRLHDVKSKNQKRDKKRSNEKKQRDLLKLRLNMTAPTDLDVDDRALQGEDDMFDLGQGEKEMTRRKIEKKTLGDVIQDEGAAGDASDSAEESSSEEEPDFEDSEEEREYRTQALEGELDELYDQYKDPMS